MLAGRLEPTFAQNLLYHTMFILTSLSCSAKNQRKNPPFGKKPLDTKKPLGMTKNTGSSSFLLQIFFVILNA